MKDALVGKFFHVLINREIIYQGIVIDKMCDTKYLVQYFDWLMGVDSKMKIVDVDDYEWQFYNTSDDMNTWYKNYQTKTK